MVTTDTQVDAPDLTEIVEFLGSTKPTLVSIIESEDKAYNSRFKSLTMKLLKVSTKFCYATKSEAKDEFAHLRKFLPQVGRKPGTKIDKETGKPIAPKTEAASKKSGKKPIVDEDEDDE